MIDQINEIAKRLNSRNEAMQETMFSGQRVKCTWSIAVVAKASRLLGDNANDPWFFPATPTKQLAVDDIVDLLLDTLSMGLDELYDPRSLGLQIRNAIGYGTNQRTALLNLIAAAAASGQGGNYPNVRDAFAVLVASCGHDIESILECARRRQDVVDAAIDNA